MNAERHPHVAFDLRSRARKLPKLAALALILLVCLPLLLQPSATQGQSTGQALEQVTLQLRWKHQFQFAGYYAAQQEDFYRNAGLDVNIVEAQDGQDPIGAVVDGDAEYGVGNSELVLWRSQGKPVVVLGVIFQHSPLVLLTTRGSGIDSLHDLIDRRVAIEENSAELLAYLQDEGISIRSLSILEHAFDPQGLIDGEIDAMSAYSTDEPFVLQSVGLEYQVFSPRSAGIDFYGDVLFTTEDEIRQHPQRVQAFVNASMLGWKYAFDHEDQLVDTIYGLTQRHSLDHLKFEAAEMRQLVLPDLIEPGYMYEGRWRAIVDTYARVGLIPEAFDVASMLYMRDAGPDLRPLYTGIAAILLVTVVGGGVSLRIYRLNHQLRRQIGERERAQAQLKESEERYRSLVETAPFAVIITRLADNTIRFINPRAEVQLKLRREEAIGKAAVNFYANPADRARFIEQVRSSDMVQDFEVRLHDTQGSEFWAAISAVSMIYEERPAIFVTFKDISERRAAEAQAFALAVEQERVNVLTAFIQNASHEFRTPLAIISSSIYLLVRSDEEARRERHAEKAEKQIELITHLVEMLTMMARLDSGAPLNLAPVDLTDLVARVARSMQPEFALKQVGLHVDASSEQITVQGDSSHLSTALKHLLENARRYTPPGGDVTIRLMLRGGEAMVEVRDTGVGIRAEALPHIFERFWREDQAHTTPGFGLGLALARTIATTHGGDIQVESVFGSGSVFRFILPLAKPAELGVPEA